MHIQPSAGQPGPLSSPMRGQERCRATPQSAHALREGICGAQQLGVDNMAEQQGCAHAAAPHPCQPVIL